MRRPLFRLALLFGCCLATGQAQSTSATLVGEVAAADGEPLAGAVVVVEESTTGLTRTATTNARGGFTVPNLPPGLYVAEATAEGHRPARTAEITLNVNDRREIRLELAEAGAGGVDVTIEAKSGLEAEPAIGATVDQTFVADLPLNGRSFQNLIAMTPGVVQTPADVERRGIFATHGARPGSTYYTVDGVSANYAVPISIEIAVKSVEGNLPALSASGGTNSMVAVDALREFDVQTSTYAPEFGRSAGAQVSMVTRSGSNDFHGSLFHYFRNDALDATNFFSNLNGEPKAATRQNDFGGVLGGPIVGDRTFFFGAYEGFRLRQPQTTTQAYPTEDTRRRAAPEVRPILDAYPLPDGPEIGGGLALLSASYTTPSELDAWSVRVDHAANATLMLFGRYSGSPSTLFQRGPDGSLPGALSFVGRQHAHARSATFGAIQMLTPTISHEARFNFSWFQAQNTGTHDAFRGAREPNLAALLPEGRSAADSQLIAVVPGAPLFVAGQFTDSNLHQWTALDSVSILAGRHEIRTGFDYRLQLPRYGEPTYGQTAVFAGLEGPRGLLNGAPVSLLIEQSESLRLRRQNFSWFLQDQWRVTSELSLTYGVRWDYNPAPRGLDGFGSYSVLHGDDPGRATLSPEGVPVYRASKTSFAPRLAGAYMASRRSGFERVIRAGIGLYYDLPIGATAALRTSAPAERSVTLVDIEFPFRDPNAAFLPFTTAGPYGLLEGFEPDIAMPRMAHWSAGVQQGLGEDRSLSLTYAGSAGRRLWRRERFVAPNPDVAVLELVRAGARSNYNALEAQFEQRLRRGLQVLASYTWSHAIDTGSSVATENPGGWDPRNDKGPSGFDVRHLFSGGWSYDLPAAGGPWRPLTRGWGVDGVFRFQSALPFDVTTSEAGPLLRPARPSLVPGEPIWLEGDGYPGGKALNPAAFEPAVDAPHGDLGRNALRAFPLRQVDLAVRRSFRLTEDVVLQFRAELFNAFNTANFAAPVAQLSDPQFGRSIRSYGRGLGGGGVFGGQNPLHAVGGPRSTQLALRLEF